jgi:hypothetical protein
MEHEPTDAATAPAAPDSGRPIPPWEAELAAQALAELKAAKPQAGTETEEQRKQRHTELLAQMEAQTARLEQEADLLNRLRFPGSLSGLSGPQIGFSLLGYLRRPEWTIIGIALFCLFLWAIATGLRHWVQNMAAINSALGQ